MEAIIQAMNDMQFTQLKINTVVITEDDVKAHLNENIAARYDDEMGLLSVRDDTTNRIMKQLDPFINSMAKLICQQNNQLTKASTMMKDLENGTIPAHIIKATASMGDTDDIDEELAALRRKLAVKGIKMMTDKAKATATAFGSEATKIKTLVQNIATKARNFPTSTEQSDDWSIIIDHYDASNIPLLLNELITTKAQDFLLKQCTDALKKQIKKEEFLKKKGEAPDMEVDEPKIDVEKLSETIFKKVEQRLNKAKDRPKGQPSPKTDKEKDKTKPSAKPAKKSNAQNKGKGKGTVAKQPKSKQGNKRR
jgi:hypothetical protein